MEIFGLATLRFNTWLSKQSQVDYSQLWACIGAQSEKIHLFVFTLGQSCRLGQPERKDIEGRTSKN